MQQTGYLLFNEKNKQKEKKPDMSPRNYPADKFTSEAATNENSPPDPNQKKHQQVEQEENETEKKLGILTKGSDSFEYPIKAYWLFELIPNEVLIDIHKVSFIDKSLMSKNVTSIFIKDIAKAEVTNDFFFASLELINVTQTIELRIKHLKKDDARNGLAIIQGLMVAYKNDINLAELDPKKMLDELMKLGSPVL